MRASVFNMLRWAGYVKTHFSEPDLKRYYEENKEFFDQVMVSRQPRPDPGKPRGQRGRTPGGANRS